MTAATYSVPNNTVDTASGYKAKIDGNAMVAQAIVGAFACHEAGTPDMTVLCDSGAISFIGQAPTIVGQQTSSTITAPATNPRNDLVVIDGNTGVAGIVTGTPAASPADPAVPEGKIAVARIALATTTTSITNALITDLRAPVLAVQGSPASLSVSTNTTLTQKQVGMSVYVSGAGVTCTLPSAIGCKGARMPFISGDANTQTLSGSFVLPDGSAASSWGITSNEMIEFESTGSAWRAIRMVGKQLVKNATVGSQQPIPILQADSRYLMATASFGGDVSGTYGAIVLDTVNANVGTFGSAMQIPVLTVDGKGRVTAVSLASFNLDNYALVSHDHAGVYSPMTAIVAAAASGYSNGQSYIHTIIFTHANGASTTVATGAVSS